MKGLVFRNGILALLALVSLAVYILACTSFSPDDTKVLYPAFTPSGAVGVAVYDREAKRSETLFVPHTYTRGERPILPVRAQWLDNGRRVLASWAEPDLGKDGGLNVAVMPFGGRGVVRVFRLENVRDAGVALLNCLATANQKLFVTGESNKVVRLDLDTGQIDEHLLAGTNHGMGLYPSPSGQGVFYVDESGPDNAVFGRLDPVSFALTPLMTITNEMSGESGFFAFDPSGTYAALATGKEETLVLQVLKNGVPFFSRSVSQAEKVTFGNAVLSIKANRVWASFCRERPNQKFTYGLMEIPLSQAPVRETAIIEQTVAGEGDGGPYFQFSISHDLKTVAVASTYLGGFKAELEPENYGLFFVDLADPNRKVTRVPLELPPKSK